MRKLSLTTQHFKSVIFIKCLIEILVDGKESPVKSKLSEVKNKKASTQSKSSNHLKTPISAADYSPSSSPLFSEQNKKKSTMSVKEKTITSIKDKTPFEDETETNEVLTLSTGLLIRFLI